MATVFHNRDKMKTISFRDDILPLKDKLFRLALRITLNTEEAEDVVQDTMVKVWQQKENWQRLNSVEAYCMTICRHLALDKTTQAGRRNVPLDGQAEKPSSLSAPDEIASRNERVRMIWSLMEKLPEIQRSILQLRDVEGYSYQEIAGILQISDTQVKVYLHRARNFIRSEAEKIDEYGL